MSFSKKLLRAGTLPFVARRAKLALLLAFALGTGLFTYWEFAANTLYVDTLNCPGPGSGTLGDPYCTIQDAICNSTSAGGGDTISVAPGTYSEAIRLRPNIKLVSQGGPSVTTIDATGQPCSESTYCTKRTGSQCSVVTFGSGHSPATLIDGFTLTGGGGLEQNGEQVAGGGIFVFSSPTISNNIITNNELTSSLTKHYGAGIYVSLGQPIITGNTISGNRLIPPNGKSKTPSVAYGAGIYVGFFSSPSITDNLITNNTAGDRALSASVGSGGGVMIFPGQATLPDPVLSRNLIADNFSDNLGGGVHVIGAVGTEITASITNNVIVGNDSIRGGGVYTGYGATSFVNNTVTDNQATIGGGMFSSGVEVGLAVNMTNNIIEGNRMVGSGSTGGGVYTFNLIAGTAPIIDFNDLWGNEKNQVAGHETDGTVIGFNGNISDDPSFVDKAMRDFHLLDGNSPAVDVASQVPAPPVDFDNNGRGFDGNGTPDNPVFGDIDVGAFEFVPNCIPEPEICDGMDNNCDLITDEGFADTDNDAMADCVDPDDDNDGVLDGSDCATLDPTAWGVPGEALNLNVLEGSPTMITFDTQTIGPGTQYEMISGLASRVRETQSFVEDFCLGTDSGTGAFVDSRGLPPPDDAWFYMIRVVNGCGNSTLGGVERDVIRAADVCQAAIVDGDEDGSPVDLDCNDADPLNSPVNPEICDGLDNNCDSVTDDGNPGAGVLCGSTDVGTCSFGFTDCQAGSLLCLGEIIPGPEFCDGLDNDCDGIPDNNVIDTDMDGMDDCADLDDDNDLVDDVSDCAPLDNTAFAAPGLVTDLDILDTLPAQLTWTGQNLGTGTLYDIGSGQVGLLGLEPFTAGQCLASEFGSPATVSADPAPGEALYYLIKSRNACGIGSYGTATRNNIPACP
jgi:hypothetical protein